ncbi:MAG TPA: ABC transporter substrate-binding protein [Candidatus Elarobacter sp.]|jgi:NitT/TauT family transport system substrate-binding protein|nr:ABC transporter substrate-binding protein [Candidatus Elarobacter sp.]
MGNPVTLTRAAFVASTAAAVLLRPGAARAATQIAAGSASDDDATPFLYAQKAGLFSRAGIEATIQPMRSGSAVASAVLGGTFQLGKSSVMSLINARGRGHAPIVIVAPAGVYDSSAPVTGLLVKADGPIKTPADLNRQVIAVSALNDLYSITTKAWIDQHGGDSSTIQLTEIPISEVPEAVAAGRVAAGNVLEPDLAFAAAKGKTRVLGHPFDSLGKRFTFSAWFTTVDYATKNRDVIEKFATALREAANYTNTHHNETVQALADFTKLDPAVIRRSTRSTGGTTLEASDVQHLIDMAVKYKALPTSFDAKEMLWNSARA